jgi:SAM-dependent methyltransferase
MATPRLYSDLAHLWPLLSPPAHYADEARVLRELTADLLGQPPAGAPWRVLELGVGGGHTLSHLTDVFRITGVDRSEPMLTNARRLLPDAELIQADMRLVDLEREFDVVLVHDSIDTLTNRADVEAVLRVAWKHTRVGGMACFAPTYDRTSFENHDTATDQQRSKDGRLVLTYLSYVHDPCPEDDTFELLMTYVINDGGVVTIAEDRLMCGLFSRNEWQEMVRRAGFEVRVHATSFWTLFVGTKPQRATP